MNKLIKDRKALRYDYLVAKEEPLSYATECIQKILVNIDFANVDNNYKVFLFTSTLPGEGKTTLIGNVAYLYAQKGKKVIVVDLDLRKPKLHRVFKDKMSDGISDYLIGNIEVDKLIKKSDLGVDYITVGERTSVITSALESQRLKDLMSKLREQYDYIFLDTPPVYNVSDALYISKLADGILYVVAQGVAKKTMVSDAIKQLSTGTTKILGICLTQVNVKELKRYGYYYNYKDE
jgi:capsular exopolysaccharide synthesis family protein